MFLVGVCFAVSGTMPAALWGVLVFLALNWFGDSLDGTLARVRGHQRPRYGFYVDHILDTFGTLFVLGGLAMSGYMTPIVAAAFLIAYYVLSIEIYLATYCVGRFRMSFWGWGPTELRILLAVGALDAVREADRDDLRRADAPVRCGWHGRCRRTDGHRNRLSGSAIRAGSTPPSRCRRICGLITETRRHRASQSQTNNSVLTLRGAEVTVVSSSV